MTSRPQDQDGNDQVPPIFTGKPGNNSPASQKPDSSGLSDSVGEAPGPLRDSRTRQTSATSAGENPLSPDSADRVFPIRSVVSVDPTPLPRRPSEQADGYFTSFSTNAFGRRQDIRSPGNVSEPQSIDAAQDVPLNNPELNRRLQEHKERRQRSMDSQSGSFDRQDTTQSERDRRSQNARAPSVGLQIFSDNASQKSERSGSFRPRTPASLRSASPMSRKSTNELGGGIVTARFKHVVTEHGHAIITGRDGDTLQRCEDEPIHIPGAIQSFGALVAMEEQSDGKFVVRIASENTKRVIGYSPNQLFALENFADILSEDQFDNLLDHVDFVRDPDTDVQANGPEVFTMSIRDSHRKSYRVWCAVHVNDAHAHLVICEFELEDDPDFPLVPHREDSPEEPQDTLSSHPTDEEYRESTEKQSRPLRVLRSARKRRGEAAAMEVFNIMSQVQEQLADAPNLEVFLKVLVGVVKELTGFHRVMIYQFDQSFNGKVVTELVDPRATKDLYKGLHFPASDIPKQARDLYRINKVRLLYDRDQEAARLVCRTADDLATPLDLTHSYLRAMSPIHVKYLTNMAVRSSMSISINAFNELWGLVSCHTYGAKGVRVSFPIRKMCRLVGDAASRNIERLSYASRLQARKLINTASTAKNPSGYIIASSDDLLKLFDADFGLLSIHEETKILGRLEATQEALAMLEYLRMRKFQSITISQDIKFDFSDLRYQPGFRVIAGLLLVPLSTDGADFIVFFRKGQLREVKWAGNPYQKFIREGTEGYLEPRKSFKMWTEMVVGKCREWTDEETETAAVLCLVYGKFIEVWRQKEAALQNTELTKLLLQNSAHEVRTPLNAIINYLEIALEGSLDQETRDNLAKSHSASKSLIYVINDLLDLTKTEPGSKLISEEAFDMRATFREAVDAFLGDAKRKQINFEVHVDPHLPHRVFGDHRKIRQAISNLTANAVQATVEGTVTVSLVVAARHEQSVDIEIAVEDTGRGISTEKQDQLFVELEQAQAQENNTIIEDAFSSEDEKSGLSTAGKPKDKATQVLGLGLAVVARIVRNMDGQLRLKSEEGKGSRFVLMFPFELQTSEDDALAVSDSINSEETEVPAVHKLDAGEVELVPKATPRGNVEQRRHYADSPSPPGLSRRHSGNSLSSANSRHSQTSLNSAKSFASGRSGKSDVDRLIEAIQEPRETSQRPLSASASRLERPKLERNASSAMGSLQRSQSVELQKKVPAYLRAAPEPEHGHQNIADSISALKPVKIPDEGNFEKHTTYNERRSSVSGPTAVSFGMSSSSNTGEKSMKSQSMRVLVAEDDPINSRIIQKRLQKSGHEPYLTVNGEECASQYCEKPGHFDVILMDMQMPIVDGMSSTKMIRSFEKSSPSQMLSKQASLNHRIPIFAVSASLMEKNWQDYIDAGFDGWILKPVMFERLNELMRGIVDSGVRKQNLYQTGKWEQGGWFFEAQPDVYSAETVPSGKAPTTNQHFDS